jgi:leucyl-tRNA synthetase
MKRYVPKELEPKWQKTWVESGIHKAVDFDEKWPKFVILTEFPYPSGDGLHLGHVREYTLGDIIARHKRMTGHNVLYPMGYDAFGLPTENFAIKNKIAPQVATEQNVSNFQKQFESLGYSIDWDRSFRTTDPSYYKWTQWLFLQFYKEGLAFQDEIAINWCPKCKTGLANEEVVNGRHERCDTPVEKKTLEQWVLKITKYADRLIDGLQDVDYPSRIADQQINWIGRSKGAEVDFQVDGHNQTIRVFTTRPDTLFGATFMVLAPEHPLVEVIATDSQKPEVLEYVKSAQAKSEIERQDTNREKTGVFTGAHAINPVNNEKIPIWIADYVLYGYGTGAIMAVPAHDERDHMFAEKFNLPIVEAYDVQQDAKNAFGGEGIIKGSGEYNGMRTEEMREKVVADLVAKGLAEEKINYKLRDWIFSRQHYWGEPIPIIHCEEHGAVPVPDDQLPVVLPDVDHYEPTDTGESPLAEVTEWVNTTCPTCGKPAKRETDTMPNWAGSSWYYLRYYDAHNDQAFADQEKLKYWGEVDLYLGGMEHTTLHLLYSRFWHQFLYDQGLVPTPEPYKARRGQGIVLATDGTKMSKSKGNIVNPNEILEQGYGADALRMSIAFLAPFDQTTPWNPEGVAGTYRFLQRVWTLTQEHLDAKTAGDVPDSGTEELQRTIHKAIKKVSSDLHEMNFNTAIAALMESVNELYKLKLEHPLGSQAWTDAFGTLLKLLAPYAPHMTEELWSQLGFEGTIHTSPWPVHDEKYLVSDTMNIVVQVNGKVRANIEVPTDADEAAVLEVAKADQKVAGYLTGEIKKSIYVPKKLVNFVV